LHVLLTKSVDELHKRIGDIVDAMRVVAEKAIDATGSLSGGNDNPGTATTSVNRGPGAWGLSGPDFEGEPQGDTKSSETLIYWESRGGFYRIRISLILNTAVRELDGHCVDLRNNLLISSRILDEQQITIVSEILCLAPHTWLKTDRIICGKN